MYLMHRISYENEASLKLLNEDNLLPIGWGILKDEYADRVVKNAKIMTKREFAKDFVEIGKEMNNDGLTEGKSYFLYNFLKLKEGDKVIIPRPGKIRMCEITGNPKKYNHPEGKDIGFVVPVKTLHKEISRHRYIRSDLSSKLKYRGTNLVLNEKDQEAIEEMISGAQKNQPIYDFSDTKSNIVDNIHHYILNLNEVHFEKLIGAYLDFIGADIVKIPSKNNKSDSNDKLADVDVKAVFINLDICIMVQAKRHEGESNDVGIRQLLAYQIEEDEDFASQQPFKWYITTGTVSEKTFNLAQNEQEVKIRVLQDKEFASLLVDSGFIFSNNIFNR